jgi:MFS family permease
MGFGSSFAYVSLLVLALNWFPKKHFGLMVGLANFLGATGPFLAGGPLSLLLNAFDQCWRLILVYISILGFLLALCVGLFVRNSPGRKKGTVIHLDPYKERLSVRLKLLAKNLQAWVIVLYSGFVYVSTPLLGAYWGTGYLMARGLSQTLSATLSSFLWIGFAIGGPLTGKLSDQMKRRKPILMLCSSLGLIGSLLLLYFPIQEFLFLASFFFLMGFASAGCSIAFATISEHVPGAVQATAIGFNNSMITFFAALFPPIVGFLIEMGTHEKLHIYTATQYETGLILMPGFYCISLILSTFCIRETFCRSQHEVVKVNFDL